MGYGVGLIGCGNIAGTWVKAVGEHTDCNLDLVFDLDRDAAQKRADESGARAIGELEEMLASVEIALVVIGTPTPSHPDLVVQAAAAGKHVLCEKPMALSLDECQRMIDACEQAGVQLVIGHSLRFWGAFRVCRRLISEGAIGTPVVGSVDRMGTAGIRKAESEEGAGGGDWRSSVRNSGGHLLEGYIHELDFTRSVFGEVASVTCELAGGGEHGGLLSPVIAHGLARFETGALVTLRTGSTVALPTRGYWISGTEGGLRFAEWGGPVEHFRADLEEKRLVTCDEPFAYYLELCDLLQAIEGKGVPENSGLNGKKNIALGLARYRSFETGRRVEFTDGIPEGVAADYQNTKW